MFCNQITREGKCGAKALAPVLGAEGQITKQTAEKHKASSCTAPGPRPRFSLAGLLFALGLPLTWGLTGHSRCGPTMAAASTCPLINTQPSGGERQSSYLFEGTGVQGAHPDNLSNTPTQMVGNPGPKAGEKGVR